MRRQQPASEAPASVIPHSAHRIGNAARRSPPLVQPEDDSTRDPDDQHVQEQRTVVDFQRASAQKKTLRRPVY